MSNKGSAMVWAVISLLIALIISAGILTLGKSVASKSISENSSSQAYLTARSAADAVVSQIDGYAVTGTNGAAPVYNLALIPTAVGGSVVVDDFSFPSAMGSCSVTVTRTSDRELKIDALAQVGTVSESVTAYMKCTVTSQSVSGSQASKVDGLFKGLFMNSMVFNANSIVQLTGSTNMRLTDIDRSGTNASTITVGGTLYTDVNITGGSLHGVPVTYGSAIEDTSGAGGELIDSYTLPYPAAALSDNSGNITLAAPATGLCGCFILTNGASSLISSGTPDANGVIASSRTITVSGDYYYLIKVTPGCTLNLKLLKSGTGTPKVYIFLDGKSGTSVSTLNIYSVASGIDLYVCGGSGSTAAVQGAVALTGFVTVDKFVLYKNFTLAYKTSTLSSGIAGSGSGTGGTTETYTWSFERYE